MELLSIAKVKKILNVTPQTLRNWDKLNKLKPIKVMGNGYRYYRKEDIDKFSNIVYPNKYVIGYCRVSSQKQKDDLERQIENVRNYLCAKGYKFEIITDIGSGINYTKNGLLNLIDKINNGVVERVVVLYKDRLLRFGFELLEYFAKINNCIIDIIDNTEKTEKTEEQELVEDLVQIVTVFSCKLQGKRSKKTKELLKIIKEDKEDNNKEDDND
jgi:predicted site-specific integrase-resolvase